MTAPPIHRPNAFAYFTRATTFASIVGVVMLFVALSPFVRGLLGVDSRVATIIGAAGALVLLITAGTNVIVWSTRAGDGPVSFGRPLAVIEEADVPTYQERLLSRLRKLSADRLSALYVLDGGSAEDLAVVPEGGRAEFVFHQMMARAGTGLKMRERLQTLVTLIEGSK